MLSITMWTTVLVGLLACICQAQVKSQPKTCKYSIETNSEQLHFRQELCRNNVKIINEHNLKRDKSFTMAANQFVFIRQDQFKRQYLSTIRSSPVSLKFSKLKQKQQQILKQKAQIQQRIKNTIQNTQSSQDMIRFYTNLGKTPKGIQQKNAFQLPPKFALSFTVSSNQNINKSTNTLSRSSLQNSTRSPILTNKSSNTTTIKIDSSKAHRQLVEVELNTNQTDSQNISSQQYTQGSLNQYGQSQLNKSSDLNFQQNQGINYQLLFQDLILQGENFSFQAILQQIQQQLLNQKVQQQILNQIKENFKQRSMTEEQIQQIIGRTQLQNQSLLILDNPITLQNENVNVKKQTRLLVQPPEVKYIIDYTNKDVDWSCLTGEARFQGSCGACYAFAAVDNVASMFAIFNLGYFFQLSAQQIVSCSKNILTLGCAAGYLEGAYLFMVKGGILSNVKYPYMNDQNQNSQSLPCKITSNRQRRFQIKSFEVSKGCQQIILTLQKHPLAVGISGRNLSKYYYQGVFNQCHPEDKLGHAVLLVGFSLQKKAWKIKNSWGYTWGNKGYGWVSMDNDCGICTIGFYAIPGQKQGYENYIKNKPVRTCPSPTSKKTQ